MSMFDICPANTEGRARRPGIVTTSPAPFSHSDAAATSWVRSSLRAWAPRSGKPGALTQCLRSYRGLAGIARQVAGLRAFAYLRSAHGLGGGKLVAM
jgi:hypothetical protein